LFPAKATVKVGANSNMTIIPGKLANVVDVIHYVKQLNTGLLRSRFASNPIRVEHPGVESHADHRASANEAFDLPIG
jgi:hypothetical protein